LRHADAKNRAEQAKDESIKGRLEQLAADWIALAEQAERIDSQKFLPRDDEKEKKNGSIALTKRPGRRDCRPTAAGTGHDPGYGQVMAGTTEQLQITNGAFDW
jgi:hypothetical protein